uniref:Uncharacterized protein n=1 Tax=Pyramimonas obovata TaxID=1411642 RepID=A0A7S0R907_9CHLO|mmetsp:Transcript_28006/g.61299  ORF Transcript_28006/g.61299 Transcript_28006/m.61299 type:complete len:495 (+) Transcript_28006:128-1612(+)
MTEYQHNEVGLTSTLNSVEVALQGLGHFDALQLVLKPIDSNVPDNHRTSALVKRHSPVESLSETTPSNQAKFDWILIEARNRVTVDDASFWQTIFSQPLSTARYDELHRTRQKDIVTEVLPTVVARGVSDTAVSASANTSPTFLSMHGLCHDTEYQVEVLIRTGDETKRLVSVVRTKRSPRQLGQMARHGNRVFELTDKLFDLIIECVPPASHGTFVGPEHFERIGDGVALWALERTTCPDDWLFMIGLDYAVVVELYKAACFTLPTFFPEPLCAVINPLERYCIDLTARGVRWDRKREMRRATGGFRLSLSHSFEEGLRRLKSYHGAASTWLTEDLLQLLVRMRNDRGECPVEQQLFELWDGDELVAVTAGFGVGCAFHDYSMGTFVRDQRSAGHVLTKTVGDLLRKAGYTIWYWGCKVGYMEMYDTYGGRMFPREEFRTRWGGAAQLRPAVPLEEALYVHEMALVKPREFDDAAADAVSVPPGAAVPAGPGQ